MFHFYSFFELNNSFASLLFWTLWMWFFIFLFFFSSDFLFFFTHDANARLIAIRFRLELREHGLCNRRWWAEHSIQSERETMFESERERLQCSKKLLYNSSFLSLWESRPKLSKSSTHSRHEEIHDGFLTSLRSTINVIFVSWPKSKLCFSRFFVGSSSLIALLRLAWLGGKAMGRAEQEEWGDDSDDEEFVGCFSTARLILSFPFFHLLSFLRHRTQQRAEASTVAVETSSTHDGKSLWHGRRSGSGVKWWKSHRRSSLVTHLHAHVSPLNSWKPSSVSHHHDTAMLKRRSAQSSLNWNGK